MVFALWILLLVTRPASMLGLNAAVEDLKAPDFALKDINGKVVRLSDYKGKVVLVNFWATWCAPCRAEMPELANWQKQNAARGLQIIGITYPPYRQQSVRRLARQLKLTYPILLGTRSVAEYYSTGDVLPVSIIIDRNGAIRDKVLGIMDTEEFRQKVEPFLK